MSRRTPVSPDAASDTRTLNRTWEKLEAAVTSCRRCPRLVAHREQVARVKKRAFRECDYWGKPVPGFGDYEATLLIVGLAPAAHGANRTGRMFTGDSSGDWLYEALHRHGFANQPTSRFRGDGLTLCGTFISAAVRCAPPDNKPLREELANCQAFLLAEYGLMKEVRVVLTLGRVALSAFLSCREKAGCPALRPSPVFTHGAVTRLPEGVYLLTSYHPSRQNTQTGRLTRPMWHSVFEKARRLVGEPGAKTEE